MAIGLKRKGIDEEKEIDNASAPAPDMAIVLFNRSRPRLEMDGIEQWDMEQVIGSI